MCVTMEAVTHKHLSSLDLQMSHTLSSADQEMTDQEMTHLQIKRSSADQEMTDLLIIDVSLMLVCDNGGRGGILWKVKRSL